jgi:PAS domain S-box-containing protein
VNRRWFEYTGLSQLGKVEEVAELAIHPEDLDRSKRRMGASFTSSEPFEEEMRFRRTDGEYRWFLSRAVPLRDKRGNVVKWYGAATDIQDRKRAEQLQADLAMAEPRPAGPGPGAPGNSSDRKGREACSRHHRSFAVVV